MAPRRRFWGAALLTSAALSFSLLGCEPASEIGLDVLPDDVPSTATYTVFYGRAATVLRNDSVLTANKANVLTGELRDANVGTTRAESYWQVRPLSTNPASPLVGATADSLVLTFGLSQFYGNADGTQRLEAYEMKRGLADDTAYYADSKGFVSDLKLGETTFKLRYAYVQNDSVPATPWIVGSTKLRADSSRVLQPVRIPITSDLKTRLLNGIGTTNMSSLTAFQNILKGIALKPGAGSSAIVNLNPLATNTRMILYYKLPSDTTTYTFVFSLGNSSEERYFTKISTDYNTGEHLKSFATPAPTPAQDTVTTNATNGFTAYLQGGLELATYIKLSGFEPLKAKKGSIVINRAELVIPVKPYAAGVYPVPAQAYLVEVDSRNHLLKNSTLPRVVQANGNAATGTAYPAVATYDASMRAYRVLLTSYLAARLNDKLLDQQGDAFWLLPTLSGSTGLGLNRALIDGAPGQIQLKVYYSELN